MSFWDDIVSGFKDVIHDVEKIVDYTEDELEDIADSIGCVFSGNFQSALADFKNTITTAEEAVEDLTLDTFNQAWNSINDICVNCLAPFGATGYFIKVIAGGVGMYLAKTSDGWVTISSDIQADFEDYVTNKILNDFARAVGAIDLSQYSGYDGTVSFMNKPVMVIDTQGNDKVTFGFAGSIYYTQGGADTVTLSQTQPLPGIVTLVNNVTLIGKLNNQVTTISGFSTSDNLQLKSQTTIESIVLLNDNYIDCGWDSEAAEHASCACTIPDPDNPYAQINVPYGNNEDTGEGDHDCYKIGPAYRLGYFGGESDPSIGSATLNNALGKLDEGGISIYSSIQPFYLFAFTDTGYAVVSCTAASACTSADASNYNHCLVNANNCFMEAILIGNDVPEINIYPAIQL